MQNLSKADMEIYHQWLNEVAGYDLDEIVEDEIEIPHDFEIWMEFELGLLD